MSDLDRDHDLVRERDHDYVKLFENQHPMSLLVDGQLFDHVHVHVYNRITTVRLNLDLDLPRVGHCR